MDSPLPLSYAELAGVRKRHSPDKIDGPLVCWRDYNELWPCDSSRLLATIEARDEEIEVLRADLTTAQDNAKEAMRLYEDLDEANERLAERLEKAEAALARYDEGRQK